MDKIIEDLEKEYIHKNDSYYKSYFYQPDRLLLNSKDAVTKSFNYNQTSFNSINFNLPKPTINVKAIQLLNINMPLSTAKSFNDYELIFPYYRIKTQRNFDDTQTIFLEQPTINNMYMVRLLPSYYPQNIIPDATLYGFNKEFNSYADLEVELKKSCVYDLAKTNGTNPLFISGDISLQLNTNENKFEATGNNINTPWSTIVIWYALESWDVNQIVTYNDVIYIAINNIAPTSTPPDIDTTNWQIYTGIYYTYLIAGYEDPNIPILQESVAIYSGLYDFSYYIYGLNDIIGIPPQPFVAKYTLSKRLGFNWQGIFTWPNQINIIAYEFNDGLPLLYNRLRPIPPYELLPPGYGSIPIPNNNPYTATTYIADGYCNLVLTSIIYVYGNFIGTSSLSSTNNTNIIAIIPMNCLPLGITFTSEFIENNLTKVNNNIQDISIDFRNEDNEPFFVGNNANITFSLKIIY
jgi:hypothetical protein